MSANSRFTYSGGDGVQPPKFKLREVEGTLSSMTDDEHESLLQYLVSRLKSGNAGRSTRLIRYSRIDKLISTWMKMSAQDTARDVLEDNTGRNQALPMNLPILAAHLEDTVSFFAEVFAPQRKDMYSIPAKGEADASTALTKRMNQDTRSRNYYGEICMALRSLTKYNVGGLGVRWENGGGQGELAASGNRIEALDMYNYIWDPSITDVAKIYQDAEWDATIKVKNRMWVERRAMKGTLQRVEKLFADDGSTKSDSYISNRHRKDAVFYKNPPNQVGLSVDGQDGKTSAGTSGSVDWESYGAGLDTDKATEIDGFEVVEMYCWLNPTQFKLIPEEGIDEGDPAGSGGENAGIDENDESYALWRFVIIDGTQVCGAWPVVTISGADPEIPHYLAYLTQDDMKTAQRSIMELLKPFQRFGSFLMNVYVAGARKNIWGVTGVDPSMFDTSQLEQGDVAGFLKSKTPGRDVRQGLQKLDSATGVQESMQMLGSTMQLMRDLFPSQALPSQIASMDRAVKSQVSAVLQGVHRRLHMVCRLLDSSLMGPMRLQCYRNLAVYDSEGLDGLTEEIVGEVLGSGLQSLNSEAIAGELREIIFAIIQNPESAQVFDIAGLFNYWSQLNNMPSSLGDFVKQQPAPAQQIPPGASPGQPGTEEGA